VYLIGEALEEQDERGRWVKDDDFLLLLNSHYEAIRFTLPWKGNSELVLDSALSEEGGNGRPCMGPTYLLQGRSLALLTQRRQAGQVAVPLLRRRYFMPVGAQLLEGGRIRFRLWAPLAERVEVSLEEPGGTVHLPMEAREAADGGEGSGLVRIEHRSGQGGRSLPVPDRRRRRIPGSGFAFWAYTVPASYWTPVSSSGTTATGGAGPGKRRSSMNCTSAPLPRRAPLQRFGDGLITCVNWG